MKLNVLNPTLWIEAEDVVSHCSRSAKAGSTPQTAAPSHQVCGGDADRFCGEVAAREGSSLGLEAGEACDEARVTASKPCAHILLLLHCQLLPSVLGVQHVRCSSVMASWNRLLTTFSWGRSAGGPARHHMHLHQQWSIALTPVQNRSNGSKLVDKVFAILAEGVIHQLANYQTVEWEVLLLLWDDLLVVASVGMGTFDHVYLTVPSGIPRQDRLGVCGGSWSTSVPWWCTWW